MRRILTCRKTSSPLFMRAAGLFALAGSCLALAACQGGGVASNMIAAAPGSGERPVQLVTSPATGGEGDAGLTIRQPLDEKELAKAVERFRLNKKKKKGFYRSVGVDLNGNGAPEAMVLMEGADWCTNTGCSLAVFIGGRTGYRPVATIYRVRGPVIVANERNNGWADLVVGTGLRKYNNRVRLRFGGNGYPGNAVVLTPMPADIEINGQVVLEQAELPLQEMAAKAPQ